MMAFQADQEQKLRAQAQQLRVANGMCAFRGHHMTCDLSCTVRTSMFGPLWGVDHTVYASGGCSLRSRRLQRCLSHCRDVVKRSTRTHGSFSRQLLHDSDDVGPDYRHHGPRAVLSHELARSNSAHSRGPEIKRGSDTNGLGSLPGSPAAKRMRAAQSGVSPHQRPSEYPHTHRQLGSTV
jgi:hypothetical protein